MLDPNRKFSYAVVQEGRDGAPIEIYGTNYQKGDTVLLTQAEAKFLIGLSIEPTGETTAFLNSLSAPAGEHRESGADIVEETRPFKEPEVHEDDDRTPKRAPRSPVAKG